MKYGIGKKLKYILSDKNIQHKELAKSLNVTKQTVSLWIRDISSPSDNKFRKLCKFLNVPESYFLNSGPALSDTSKDIQELKQEISKLNIRIENLEQMVNLLIKNK